LITTKIAEALADNFSTKNRTPSLSRRKKERKNRDREEERSVVVALYSLGRPRKMWTHR
jgi:hypothetical protein